MVQRPHNLPLQPSTLRLATETIARDAGAFALANQNRRGEVDSSYHHDIKLRMDVETQLLIEGRIRKQFPDHGFLGEEGENQDEGKEFVWVIDPIDGTMNYYRGFPYWCTSIAVTYRGSSVAGTVFSPILNECYSASIDEEATLNGQPIVVSDVSDLEACILVTSGLFRVVKSEERTSGFLNALGTLRKVRVLGAAALDLCQVAAGVADAMYESELKVWDIAAAGLIARKAGATVAQFGERHGSSLNLMASTPSLFEQVRHVLDIQDVRAWE